MRETPKCPAANGCNRTRDKFQPGRGFATPPRLARWKASAGTAASSELRPSEDRRWPCQAPGGRLPERSESRPAPQDGDRRLHSFNVSYLGHGVKEARASAENNGPSRRLCGRIFRGRSRGTTRRLGDEGDFAVFLTSGLYGDLHVLAESGEKVHEALDGKGA